MRRILIVEDEALLRQGLLFLGPWETFGYEIVASVGSGDEALALLRVEAPDVVLSDIVMPGMNGIELLRRIRALWPKLAVLMLSNYDEFDYVRQALQAGASDYLLKSEASFEQLIAAMDHALGSGPDTKRTAGVQRDTQLFLHRLLLDNRMDEDALKGMNAELAQPLALPCRLIVIGARPFLGEEDADAPSWIWLDDIAPPDVPRLIRTDHITLLMRPEDFKRSIQYLQVSGLARRLDICALYSPPIACLSNIRHWYEAACVQRALWFYADENPMLPLEEAFSFTPLPPLDCGVVEALLKADGLASLLAMIDAQFTIASDPAHFASPAELLHWCEELLHAAIMHGAQYHPDIEKTRQMLVFFHSIANLPRVGELRDNVSRFLLSLYPDQNKAQGDETPALATILGYIDLHYREPLTLGQIANRFHRNYYALSKAFSSALGIGMLEYVTQLRMEEACALLASSQESISEIAARVGYADAGYFSRAFRKRYGVSPRQFRENPPPANR